MQHDPGQDAPDDEDPFPELPGPPAPGEEDDGSFLGTWAELENTLADAAARAELLAGFEPGGTWATGPPGPELAAAVTEAAGKDGTWALATGAQRIGLLRAMAALQSWSSAGLLGVARALIRDASPDAPPSARHGILPDDWDESLTHEVALALAVSARSADLTLRAAWELGARLPGTDLLLANGTLDLPRAKLIAEVFADLSDDNAAKAEQLLLPRLTQGPRKTWTQIEKIATAIAAEVDPDLAERQRKNAQKLRCRVTMFRERSGTASLNGRDLPADQTLAAYANVNARADQYKHSGAFPSALMDRLRATAYLDILNAIPADDRIAYGHLIGDDDEPDHDRPDDDEPDGDEPDGSGPDGGPEDGLDDGRGDSEPAGGPTDGDRPTSSAGGEDGTGQPKLTDLVLPLATLLGLARRPGEGHGLGTLDPALCRALAATAARSPRTTVCLTITDHQGIAIGHGCAKPARTARLAWPPGGPPGGPPPPLVALPARINLTITATRLAQLRALHQAGPPGRAPTGWALAPPGTPASRTTGTAPARPSPAPPGDPDWCGTWTLTLPAGHAYAVNLGPVPTYDCDHRNESRAYQPNDTLRHLVQVRDHECTFPTCNRHAREADFEHALPYDQGGRTCACNAGARSRKCHRVKQSPGWTLTQPTPGWHQWTTPRGWTYTQGPKRYPV